MAYIIKLSKKCYIDGCSKEATYRLYNRMNSEMGDFCTPHAKERLKRVEQSEKVNHYDEKR